MDKERGKLDHTNDIFKYNLNTIAPISYVKTVAHFNRSRYDVWI